MPRTTSVLAYWNARTPDAVAVRDQRVSLTWRELADSVQSLASGLFRLGLQRGDRLAYLSTNSVEVIQTILAAHTLGAVAVPLNVRLTSPELAWIIEDAQPTVLLSDAGFADRAADLHAQFPELATCWVGPEAPSWSRPIHSVHIPGEIGRRGPITSDDEFEVAFLSYTSGTTGRPKGAMLTHRNVVAAAQSFALTETLTRHDTSLLVLPLAFTGSLMATWAPIFYAGGTFVLHGRFSADDVLAELSSGRISLFYAVPFVFEELARHPDFEGADLSALRVAKAGGAPSSAMLLARYAARGIPIGPGYGLTESTGVGASLPQEDFERKAGFTGITNFGIDLRIVDATGNDCAPDEVGEIWMRGPSVMLGYWRDTVASAKALDGGWLHTGDLGLRDAEGYLKVVGRDKDMLLSGGLNVYPGEIERVLLLVDGVDDAAVVGVPDERWGEVPVAVLVAQQGSVNLAAVTELCRRELADYKVPKRIVVQSQPLPRTMSGKVAKAVIRDEVIAAGTPPASPAE